MKFYIVDAFTDTLFGGNPAGVVILDNNADFPEPEIMRKVAAELRYSETAFIKQTGDKEFNIRYFTPASEVDLCGHATIGSFYALADLKLVESGSTYINNNKAGKLNINVSKNSILMDMGLPEAINKIDDTKDLKELYCIMGLSFEGQGEILTGEKKGEVLIPEMISTGLPDIMMPVRNEDELAAIKPDFEKLSKLSENYKVVGVHAFTINTDDKAVHCRNFAPLYDIDEEAATGTSNGALTYYLYKNGLLHEGTDNLFIQGEAMNRPSKIMSKLYETGNSVKIQVGGMATILAQGEIRI
ncbi:PhzF family phenazine biosynthesis protein [Sedimentibacter sp. MB31-C6]|uniref:PhzF family phenazine biosynthesis protein n=1 Tax=Sedimentibacter sp. MB31-C6 TaxID=3109366 RepID=UPI002DDD1683|nr:PhzF family phenazine biosynthesis protein [Sedimentibacter sp. MB36-C1]WSI04772.1 PhzF family phenazine biosynthesis protein [Sedimentibacter sp. MB36-C1]